MFLTCTSICDAKNCVSVLIEHAQKWVEIKRFETFFWIKAFYLSLIKVKHMTKYNKKFTLRNKSECQKSGSKVNKATFQRFFVWKMCTTELKEQNSNE